LERNCPNRAVVVGDVLLYRDGVAAGLERRREFELVGLISSAEAADVLRRLTVDIVFLDMSRAAALQLPRLLAPFLGGAPIIGFGVATNDEALAAAEAGINAFVGAAGTIDDLCEAGLLALEGKAVLSPTFTAMLVQRVAALAVANAPSCSILTRREHQVACLIDDGLSNKEIAGTLNISPATVKNHVHTILEKLNVTRRNAVGRSLGAIPATPGRLIARY